MKLGAIGPEVKAGPAPAATPACPGVIGNPTLTPAV
jgi:hypothetical protein